MSDSQKCPLCGTTDHEVKVVDTFQGKPVYKCPNVTGVLARAADRGSAQV